MRIDGNSALYAMMDLLRRPAAVPDRPAGSAINDMLAERAGGAGSAEKASSGQAASSAINDMLASPPPSRQDSLQLSGGARSALSLAAFG